MPEKEQTKNVNIHKSVQKLKQSWKSISELTEANIIVKKSKISTQDNDHSDSFMNEICKFKLLFLVSCYILAGFLGHIV